MSGILTILCLFTKYGDSHPIPEVVRYPHFEVPYPQLKRGQQTLGALVAVVRPFRYIYVDFGSLLILFFKFVSHDNFENLVTQFN